MNLFLLECGRTFQDNSGSFTSPNYYITTAQTEAEKCEWRITATHGERIVLNITDLVIIYAQSDFADLKPLLILGHFQIK